MINLRDDLGKRAALREASINALNSAFDLVLPGSVHLGVSARLAPLQKRAGESQLLVVRQPNASWVISANFELTA